VVPLLWDNIDAKLDGTEFVRVQSAHASGTIAALGNEKYRRTLILTLNIWTPEGGGQQRSDEVSEVVLDFLETFSLASWTIEDPGLIDAGVFDGYYQASALATLKYDTLRT